MGRLSLAGAGWKGMASGVNAIVFAKVYRHQGHWQVMTMGQPMTVADCSSWEAMVPALQGQGISHPPSPPPQMPQGGASPSPPEGTKVQKPSKLWPCVALAAGTAIGVGAAIAIFH